MLTLFNVDFALSSYQLKTLWIMVMIVKENLKNY